jgi:hypothetical protein
MSGLFYDFLYSARRSNQGIILHNDTTFEIAQKEVLT